MFCDFKKSRSGRKNKKSLSPHVEESDITLAPFNFFKNIIIHLYSIIVWLFSGLNLKRNTWLLIKIDAVEEAAQYVIVFAVVSAAAEINNNAIIINAINTNAKPTLAVKIFLNKIHISHTK